VKSFPIFDFQYIAIIEDKYFKRGPAKSILQVRTLLKHKSKDSWAGEEKEVHVGNLVGEYVLPFSSDQVRTVLEAMPKQSNQSGDKLLEM